MYEKIIEKLCARKLSSFITILFSHRFFRWNLFFSGLESCCNWSIIMFAFHLLNKACSTTTTKNYVKTHKNCIFKMAENKYVIIVIHLFRAAWNGPSKWPELCWVKHFFREYAHYITWNQSHEILILQLNHPKLKYIQSPCYLILTIGDCSGFFPLRKLQHFFRFQLIHNNIWNVLLFNDKCSQ